MKIRASVKKLFGGRKNNPHQPAAPPRLIIYVYLGPGKLTDPEAISQDEQAILIDVRLHLPATKAIKFVCLEPDSPRYIAATRIVADPGSATTAPGITDFYAYMRQHEINVLVVVGTVNRAREIFPGRISANAKIGVIGQN